MHRAVQPKESHLVTVTAVGDSCLSRSVACQHDRYPAFFCFLHDVSDVQFGAISHGSRALVTADACAAALALVRTCKGTRSGIIRVVDAHENRIFLFAVVVFALFRKTSSLLCFAVHSFRTLLNNFAQSLP